MIRFAHFFNHLLRKRENFLNTKSYKFWEICDDACMEMEMLAKGGEINPRHFIESKKRESCLFLLILIKDIAAYFLNFNKTDSCLFFFTFNKTDGIDLAQFS